MGKEIIDSSTNKIVARVHDDGYITEGTSRKIVAKVHDDGYITEGTSKKIVGKVKKDGGNFFGGEVCSGGGVIVAALIIGFLLFFGMFKVPEIVIENFSDLSNVSNLINAISILIMYAAMFVACIIANKICQTFFSGLLSSFGACLAVGAIYIILDNIILERGYSFFMMLVAVPIGAFIFSVFPAVVFSCGYYVMKKASKKEKITLITAIAILVATLSIGSYIANNRTYSGYWYSKVEGGICIDGFDGEYKEKLVVPNTIDGHKVVGIGDGVFNGHDAKEVVIPSGVIKIGDEAFSNCNNLEKVEIPTGGVSIGESAFSRCVKLVEITIPASVVHIGKEAFAYCESLEEIVVPTGVTNFGSGMFYKCYSLKKVTLPTGITEIGESTFGYCDKLESITIPSNVTKIGKGAFSGCSGLKNVIFKETQGWEYEYRGETIDKLLLEEPSSAAKCLTEEYKLEWTRKTQ